MGIDRANIFRLNEETFKEYEKDPFLDCFESTKQFAQALKLDIETKETPHTLLLSADYGMGKTFFSTRFTQFLRNENFDVIYFSVWENDYMKEPFVAFSKAIVNYIYNKFTAKKFQNGIDNLFSKIQGVVSAVSIDFCGVGISAEKLIDTFKEPADPVLEFRKQLADFISKLKNKKLILIVDELDRCRPDYAMKTLECIKHFFDIEGLFVILPTNINALNNCTKSLYGFDNCNKQDKENYFKKFFNDERTIGRPNVNDYGFILKQLLIEQSFDTAFKKGLLCKKEGAFNSINTLCKALVECSESACLTIREFKDLVYEIIRMCNNFYEPVRVEWLVCLMAYKNKDKGSSFVYPLPFDHCFRHANSNSKTNIEGKEYIFQLNEYKKVFRELRPTYDMRVKSISLPYIRSSAYRSFINRCNQLPSDLNSYAAIENFLNKIFNELAKYKDILKEDMVAMNYLYTIETAIAKQAIIIREYQSRFGSDDNDNKRKKQYMEIVENPEYLYSFKDK